MSLKNIHFILIRPQIGENIGLVARAIKNFKITKLRIINPRCEWPNQKAIVTSVGAKDILKSTKIYNSIEKSIGDLDAVFATTSRIRKVNKRIISIIDLKKKIDKKHKIGIVFGPEASGLTNDEINYADYWSFAELHEQGSLMRWTPKYQIRNIRRSSHLFEKAIIFQK